MSSGFRVLHLVRPFLGFLPEVKAADRKISFREKTLYTCVALFVFLVCSQLPLYGINTSSGADPFYWARVIMASNRGTCMELGISPIVTSGLVIQLLSGSKIIEVDEREGGQSALNGAQKLLGVLITIGEAVAYVVSGIYGDVRDLGVGNAMLIIIQLFFAGIIVICLDELLQKGYGLGSGISLFIATNQCESIIWKAFSPTTVNTGRGTEFEGAIIALFPPDAHAHRQSKDRVEGSLLPHELAEHHELVVYYPDFPHRDLLPRFPCRFADPIEAKPWLRAKLSHQALLHLQLMPIILQSALVSNLYFISQLLYKRYGGNFFIQLFGRWHESESNGQLIPTGGLVYYISPPTSLADVAANPLHAIFYVTFMLSACALFSKTWIEVAGSSARDVAKQLKQQQMIIKGHRDVKIEKELNRYIPIAAAFGGMCIGALTIVADFFGAIGSGTGILLAVTIIYQYFETFEKERALRWVCKFSVKTELFTPHSGSNTVLTLGEDMQLELI